MSIESASQHDVAPRRELVPKTAAVSAWIHLSPAR